VELKSLPKGSSHRPPLNHLPYDLQASSSSLLSRLDRNRLSAPFLTTSRDSILFRRTGHQGRAPYLVCSCRPRSSNREGRKLSTLE